MYSYNMIQANSDALSYSQEAARCCHLNMTYFKRSKRSDKGQHQTCPRFWCGEYLCKITKRYRQFLQSYRVHKAAWPWASLKVQKDHTKVNVKFIRDFYVENIHVKLQHDTGNLWRVIAFARFRTLPTTQCPPRQRQNPSAYGGWGVKIKNANVPHVVIAAILEITQDAFAWV